MPSGVQLMLRWLASECGRQLRCVQWSDSQCVLRRAKIRWRLWRHCGIVPEYQWMVIGHAALCVRWLSGGTKLTGRRCSFRSVCSYKAHLFAVVRPRRAC